MRLPNADRSRAVLIGTSTFAGELAEDPLTAVPHNVADLVSVLTDPDFGGFRPEHCRELVDSANPKDILRSLTEAAQQATDVLLVYLASHALPKDPVGNELFICLPGTNLADGAWWLDALAFNDIRRIVRESAAAVRIVIVDTCFAGIVLSEAMSGRKEQLFDVTGAYTLTAVGPNDRAAAPRGRRHTAFTGALIQVLSEGIDAHDEMLSLPRIFPYLHHRLQADGFPEPYQHHTQTAEQLAVVRNRATASILTAELTAGLRHDSSAVRHDVVAELYGRYAGASCAGRAEIREALSGLLADDSKRVAAAAERALHHLNGGAPRPDPPEPTFPGRLRRQLIDPWWILTGAVAAVLSTAVLCWIGWQFGSAVVAAPPIGVLGYLAAVIAAAVARPAHAAWPAAPATAGPIPQTDLARAHT